MSLLLKAVTNFTGLTDTPDSYAGQAGLVAKVNALETALQFATQANPINQYSLPSNIIPDEFETVATLNLTANAVFNVQIAGKYAIINKSNGGFGWITIVDVSNPLVPVLKDEENIGNSARGVFVAGQYIYCTIDSNRFAIYDWSDASSLTLVSTTTLNAATGGTAISQVGGLWVRGRYAYILGSTAGNPILEIFDISNPAAPVWVGELSNANFSRSNVYVRYNVAFIYGERYLCSVDVTDPTTPALVQAKDVTGLIGGWTISYPPPAVNGNRLYIPQASSNSIYICDISNPNNMLVSQTITDADLADAWGVAVAGTWLFASSTNPSLVLSVWDCSDLAAITEQYRLEKATFTTLTGIALAGSHLFSLGASAEDLTIYKVFSVDMPAIVGNQIWADQIYTNRLSVFDQMEAGQALIGGYGVPEALTRVMSIPLVLSQVVAAAPGAAYVELTALYRDNIDFSRLSVKQARVIVSGIGNEAGNDKGIEVYDSTNAAQICEVTWNGNAQQNGLVGTWTDCNLRVAVGIQVRVKASSGTENITVDKVELQLLLN